MKGTDLPNQSWFKSTYSNGQAACVEVAHVETGVATRDSKDPTGPALLFNANAWTSFIREVASGEFQQP